MSLKQYWPPRGPVQMLPERHEQGSIAPRCGAIRFKVGLLDGAPEQIFLEALTEPSLHTNLAPAQCATPPLLPEQG
jgi:hypothetical protein